MLSIAKYCFLILMVSWSFASAQFSTQRRRDRFSTKQNRDPYSVRNLRSQHRFTPSSGVQVQLVASGTTTASQGPNVCGSVCCRGWKLSKQGYCILPICIPSCQNQGLCWWPNKCRCKYAYQGKTCAFKRYGTGLATMRVPRRKKNYQNERLVSIYTLPRALSPIESRKARTCLSVVCSNGGGCLRGRCICPRDFIGPRCERPVPKTSAIPNFNSSSSMHFRTFPRSVCRYLCKYGSCVPTQIFGRSTCSCFTNYRGTFCDVKSISKIQRPRTQRYSVLKTKGQLGNCYMRYRRNVCSLALVGKRTAKSCCNSYGVAWGPRCIPCHRIRGSKVTKKFPRTMHCPSGFIRVQAACQDINECNISPTKCRNGRCVNVRGGFWCLCDAGFHLNRNRKMCLPNAAREIASGNCYTILDASGNCPRFGPLRGKKSDCCCSVGVAWGHRCELCPAHGSDEKRRMCPFGTLHPETIPKHASQSGDIDISVNSTQTTAPHSTTDNFSLHQKPHTALYRELQENLFENQEQRDSNTNVFDVYHNRSTVEEAESIALLRRPVRITDTMTVTAETTPDPSVFATQQEATFAFSTLQPSTEMLYGSFPKTLSPNQNRSGLDGTCTPTSCLNGGSCQSSRERNSSCICQPEYFGAKCERERLRMCYLDSRQCTNQLASNITMRECCCSIGRAWEKCKACPRIRSALYRKLCPHGQGLTQQSQSVDAIDINECDVFASFKICRNGKCVNSYGAFECLCRRGFYYNTQRKACWDVNECSRQKNCMGGTCINAVGSYKCVCPRGSALKKQSNGQRCTVLKQSETSRSILGATTFPETVSTAFPRAQLSSVIQKQPCFTRRKRRIMCTSRFSIKTTYEKCCCSIGKAWGRQCTMCPRRGSNQYQNLCSNKGKKSTLKPTKRAEREMVQCGKMKCAHGTCVRRRMGLACVCNKGYKLNTRTQTCEDINECIARQPLHPLCNGGRCVNTNGSFRCVCLNGWRPLPTRLTVCVRQSTVIDTIPS